MPSGNIRYKEIDKYNIDQVLKPFLEEAGYELTDELILKKIIFYPHFNKTNGMDLVISIRNMDPKSGMVKDTLEKLYKHAKDFEAKEEKRAAAKWKKMQKKNSLIDPSKYPVPNVHSSSFEDYDILSQHLDPNRAKELLPSLVAPLLLEIANEKVGDLRKSLEYLGKWLTKR